MLQVAINIREQVGSISRLTEFAPTIAGLLRGFIYIAGLAAFFYMLWGALDWITAGGEASKVEAGRKKITQSVIGLVVLMAVGAMFLVLQYFLGIRIITGSGGGGSVGSGSGGGSATCSGGVAIGQEVSDGGAGGYCEDTQGGPTAAVVRCVGAGQGPSGFNYPHYEPVRCASGQKAWNW